jgi:recombination protein RecT
MSENKTPRVADTLHGVANPFAEVNKYGLEFRSECLFAHQQITASDQAITAFRSNPGAVQSAIMNVGAIGISLNPATKLAYMVPRGGVIRLDISYRGLLRLATESGAISWAKSELVYEGDEFKWNGMFAMPEHSFDPFDKSRVDQNDGSKGLRGAYCVAKTPDGSIICDFLPADELLKIRNESKAKNGPWKKWFRPMALKSMLKRASNTWPQAPGRDRFDTAVAVLNEHEGMDTAPEPPAGLSTDQVDHIRSLLEQSTLTEEDLVKKARADSLGGINPQRYEAVCNYIKSLPLEEAAA